MKNITYVSLEEAAEILGFEGNTKIWFALTANGAQNFPRFWIDGETKTVVELAVDYLIDTGFEHFLIASGYLVTDDSEGDESGDAAYDGDDRDNGDSDDQVLRRRRNRRY